MALDPGWLQKKPSGWSKLSQFRAEFPTCSPNDTDDAKRVLSFNFLDGQSHSETSDLGIFIPNALLIMPHNIPPKRLAAGKRPRTPWDETTLLDFPLSEKVLRSARGNNIPD